MVPGTWAFCITLKRRPDGSLNKFKARFCVRGGQQCLLLWVHLLLPSCWMANHRSDPAYIVMAASMGLHTHQIDFVNAFCQVEQKEDLFVDLPPYYKVAQGQGERRPCFEPQQVRACMEQSHQCPRCSLSTSATASLPKGSSPQPLTPVSLSMNKTKP